jgi:hypothetical protein
MNRSDLMRQGGDCCGVFTTDATDESCMLKCREFSSCKYWVRRGTTCHLKSSMGKSYAASGAQYGPACCNASANSVAGAAIHNDASSVADLNADGPDGRYHVPSHWNLW